MCSWIYTKCTFIFSVKHIQFIVKKHSRPHVSVLQSHHQAFRPDDGSVEPKHVAFNVFLTINWMCLTEEINVHFVYIQEHIGMTNVTLLDRQALLANKYSKKAWWWLCRVETCRLECVFNNKLDVFDGEKNLHFVYIQEHTGMTNVIS